APPGRYIKITRLALAGKCGDFGASGFSSPRASCESRGEKTAGNIIDPQNRERTICRREWSQQSLPIVLLYFNLYTETHRFPTPHADNSQARRGSTDPQEF